MQNNRYFHIRINLDETNVFDESTFEINESFENNRSISLKNTSTVPYDLIENNNILNKEKGFFKFLDDINESEIIIDFNDLELRRKVIETIANNCHFLNARYWENIFEKVRKLNYNDLPSRKKCIYVCEGIEELSFWYEKLTLESGNQKAIIYELELDEKKIFKCDAKILELGILWKRRSN